MQSINAIIIDDERKPAEALKIKIESLQQNVRVEAICSGVADGIEKILLIKPQLLFLDIEMPEKSGLELLTMIRNANIVVEVIVVSAYSRIEYLRQSFQLAAVDYLLKPVMVDELEAAILRARERWLNTQREQKNATKDLPSNRQLSFNCPMGKIFIVPDQLAYIKAEGNYSRFHLIDGRNELVTESLKELEQKFTDTNIVRVDRSHFINRNHVHKIGTSNNRCYFGPSVVLGPLELSDTAIRLLSS